MADEGEHGHEQGGKDARASGAVRRPRADARRNHARLLEAAKAVFAQKGSSASLEEITRSAGVGIGTLYRHFPTRDALIEAVYRNETQQLAEAAEHFTETLPPVEALRAWMLLFVDHLAVKHGMAEALGSLVGGPSALCAASGAQVKEAIARLVARAAASGEIRLDMDPLDLLRALAGVASIATGPDWQPSARRLVEILIAGVRTGV